MATIKAIEGRTVHQIQSGQVIVDLCSVVKELVENSLDADSTSIDVRFKGNGLESVEVQDNGAGIARENYETLALKHYTSKLSSFEDLSSLQTFGFRGEALSSLCALSQFHIVTTRENEAPRGSRLDFESSGKLKGTSIVASQKGTTVVVENLFFNLPVRRRELEKNIKREYGKALGVLQSYACISTGVKFSVSNIVTKAKKTVAFATKSNPATRENISNVFGAKTVAALIELDLRFELDGGRGLKAQTLAEDRQVRVVGHVSRPAFGEGRQTPDRQMFFVNARPCVLPQFARVFNEVYKSYNLSQSPFIFANIILDTNSYDVNVSPDKKTILLHEQNSMLEFLRGALVDLFEKQDQTVPQSQRPYAQLNLYKPLTISRQSSSILDDALSETDEKLEHSTVSAKRSEDDGASKGNLESPPRAVRLLQNFASQEASATSETHEPINSVGGESRATLYRKNKPEEYIPPDINTQNVSDRSAYKSPVDSSFSQRVAKEQDLSADTTVEFHDISEPSSPTVSSPSLPIQQLAPVKPTRGVVQNAFERIRPRRDPEQIATITIGSRTTTTLLGSSPKKRNIGTPSLLKESTQGQFARNDLEHCSSGDLNASVAPNSTPILGAIQLSTDDETIGVSNDDRQVTGHKVVKTSFSLPAGAESSEEEQLLSDVEVNSRGFGDSDEDYIDEEEKKRREDALVAGLIQKAEETMAAPTQDRFRRASKILTTSERKDSTTQLSQIIRISTEKIDRELQCLELRLRQLAERAHTSGEKPYLDEKNPEHRLALIVSKEDFGQMEIIGQFNLGFILAFRPGRNPSQDDDIFIIDQHASDEKYNFERLQATTTVQNQRLVQPKPLDLTAIEEEIILENNSALIENGFQVEIDQSGDRSVGQRCKLVSLPMSREVTFGTRDLEELIALLSDSPSTLSGSTTNREGLKSSYIPRPSKVRRMFAMRACRSSVMIGKTLQKRQMETLVRHMGEIDKPWNCPHGRPTMRHVMGLGTWDGWKEGDGLVGLEPNGDERDGNNGRDGSIDWNAWLAESRDPGGKDRSDDDEELDTEEDAGEEEEEDNLDPTNAGSGGQELDYESGQDLDGKDGEDAADSDEHDDDSDREESSGRDPQENEPEMFRGSNFSQRFRFSER